MIKKIIFISLILLVLIMILLWIAGWFLSKPALQRVGDCPKELKCENVEFQSESESLIKGWLVDGVEEKGVVILMHGVRGNRSGMIERIKFLNNAGFSVLSFDFQSHGESVGDQITFGYQERLDSDAAIAFAEEKFPNKRIGIVGISMGGAAFLLSDKKFKADALILEMVYGSMEKAVENRLNVWLFNGAEVFEPILTAQFYPRIGVSIDGLRPIAKIEKLEMPKLFIVGEKDSMTTLEESNEFYETARNPKDIWVVKNGKHEDLHKLKPNDYETKVTQFFEKHLDKR